MNYLSNFLCYRPMQAGNKSEETMLAISPDVDGHIPARPEEPGFTDDAFDARYDGKQSHSGSCAAGQATANSHADLTSPRSRNSFMRARCEKSATASNR
jgi:hypothetical protein